MKEARRLYQLLVDLAEFDPELARPGDWLNYHAALGALTQSVGQQTSTLILNTGDPRGLRAVEEELRPLVEDFRRVVRQYAADGSVNAPEITIKVAATKKGLFAHGGTRDVAILAAVWLLTMPGRAPIAICPEDERLFVRVRRQQYCSRKCVNRANVRAYRTATLEKAKKKATTKKRRAR